MTPYEKLLKEISSMKELIVTVAENSYKTEQSHSATLETMKQLADGFKSLSARLDEMTGTAHKKNPNEGYVLCEEDCFDGMTHFLIGFKKKVSDVDFETMKQECVEKYGMEVSFAHLINERLAEVYLQGVANENNQ